MMNYQEALIYLSALVPEQGAGGVVASTTVAGKKNHFDLVNMRPAAVVARATREEKNHFDLVNMRAAAELLGNPQNQVRVIHVAGSKGKGSVSAMIFSLLRAAGFRVGLYTSPHFREVRERVRGDGGLISQVDFARCASEILTAINGKVTLSYFEFLALLAFVHFAAMKFDYAVIEVGLGGRLDATNIVAKPLATVLMPIELEHREILGDTLEKIAGEKLGIVKAGVPLFVAPQSDEVVSLAQARCAELGVLCYVVSQLATAKIVERGREGYVFDYRGVRASGRFVNGLLGDHQVENARVALVLMEQLFPEIDTEVWELGLKEVDWPGRFQVRQVSGVTTIFDVAHTVNSIAAFLKTYSQVFAGRRRVYVISLFRNKAVAEILVQMLRPDDVFVFTSSHNAMSLSGQELFKIATDCDDRVRLFSENATEVEVDVISCFLDNQPQSALDFALKLAKKNEAVVCVIGSHHHIGELGLFL